MARTSTPEEALRRTAARQHAAFSLDQALDAGLTARQLERQVAVGRLRRSTRGVYVVAGSPDTSQQRHWVAFLASGRRGVVSHTSAAALHGLLGWPLVPQLLCPSTASVRSEVARVRRSDLLPVETVLLDGLAVTSPARTLVDLAGVLDRPTLEEVVDLAFCRRLAEPDEVRRASERPGAPRRGRAQLRGAVELWGRAIRPESVAEARLLRHVRELGYDGVVTQYEVRDELGRFVARLDLALPALRGGFEYDGVEWHAPRRWAHDETRAAELRRLGWDVPSITKADLLPGATRIAEHLERWTRRPAA